MHMPENTLLDNVCIQYISQVRNELTSIIMGEVNGGRQTHVPVEKSL